MEEFAIDIQDLTKVFGKNTVVDHISLQIKKGTIFGVLGSNGSGKTTTIRMICGLLTTTEGQGSCLGYNIKTQSELIKTRIGYMPQRFSLYLGLTVYENLRFLASLYHLTDPSTAIETIIEDLGLTPYREVKAMHLSGGWKQRLALAGCLVHRPALLFLDEPTAGVDPKARKDFWDYLHKIAMRDGTTVLVTTHYMDEAEKCTDLAYISLGRLLYAGATADLIPFSKVSTYLVDTDRAHLATLHEEIKQAYADFLVSIINNTLRVSSRDKARLEAWAFSEKAYQLKAVTPSFEEVFIGLMEKHDD